MSSASSRSPDGTPSTMAVSRGPCDSPAVIQRSRDMVLQASAGTTPVEDLRLSLTLDGVVRFEVRARPRARANRIAGVRQGALVVDLAAPPVDGAANEALVETLADALWLAKNHVRLVRGQGARLKLVEVLGVPPGEVRTRLAQAIP
jgi:uncharacterized protein